MDDDASSLSWSSRLQFFSNSSARSKSMELWHRFMSSSWSEVSRSATNLVRDAPDQFNDDDYDSKFLVLRAICTKIYRLSSTRASLLWYGNGDKVCRWLVLAAIVVIR